MSRKLPRRVMVELETIKLLCLGIDYTTCGDVRDKVEAASVDCSEKFEFDTHEFRLELARRGYSDEPKKKNGKAKAMTPVTTVGARTTVSFMLYADEEFNIDYDADKYHIELDRQGYVLTAWINDEHLGMINVTDRLVANEKLYGKIREYLEGGDKDDDNDCEMTLAHRESERELEEK